MTNGMTRAQSLRYACGFIAGRYATEAMPIEASREWPPIERVRRACCGRAEQPRLYTRAGEPQEVESTGRIAALPYACDADAEARRAKRLAKFKHLLPRK